MTPQFIEISGYVVAVQHIVSIDFRHVESDGFADIYLASGSAHRVAGRDAHALRAFYLQAGTPGPAMEKASDPDAK